MTVLVCAVKTKVSGRIRNEAFDANTIVVDDATSQQGEAGESERAHLSNPVISFSKVLFPHSSVSGQAAS